jgi:hypothetical protein
MAATRAPASHKSDAGCLLTVENWNMKDLARVTL